MLPPLPTRRRLQRVHDFEANTRLRYQLSTLHERRCRHPCKTRFRLAGSAFAGRASNPLGRSERFQATSVLLSRAYPDASWVHARRPFFVMADITENVRRTAQGKSTGADLAAGLGSGPAHRRIVRDRAINQWPDRRSATSCPPAAQRTAGRRPGELDARTTRQAFARQRRRQSHGVHAQALACIRPLPRRRAHLPIEQCSRTSASRNSPRQKIMALRRLRRWRVLLPIRRSPYKSS
jgi:hypothetical protein